MKTILLSLLLLFNIVGCSQRGNRIITEYTTITKDRCSEVFIKDTTPIEEPKEIVITGTINKEGKVVLDTPLETIKKYIHALKFFGASYRLKSTYYESQFDSYNNQKRLDNDKQ